ncbi:MAG TPA: signal recognition particle-docking protein FtsY [Candidatus Binataceae bacterium]|nr:signal recognition particle-docking protein FtsY [Candidatus Binataceae bacterium]
MNPLLLVLAIALGAQLPLLGLAILLEFSQRKARPVEQAPIAVPRAPTPESAPTAPDLTAAPPSLPSSGDEPPTLAPLPPVEAAVPSITGGAEQAELPPPPAAEAAAPEAEAPVPTAEPSLPEVSVPPAEPVEAAPKPREPARLGLGLRRTRENFLARIRAAISGSAKLDEIYENLEEALIAADVGVETSLTIVEAVRKRLKNDARTEVIRDALKDEIERILLAADRPLADSGENPTVVLMAGVNGVGKTTTVAKLAAMLKAEGRAVIVAAADTFRAAAIEQLEVWCARTGVELIKQSSGSDPAAVAFDAVKAAVARKADAVIIDTAGRLQTKVNLMEELKKIARVTGREIPGAPHETWLVLDATTGQNALSQAKVFGEAVKLTGVVLAKLDSTAKGGVVVAIAERLGLPVRFVGLGEGLEDLRRFDPHEFVDALFADAETSAESASGTYAA